MIGLIDVDGKIPNLALMKLSTYYKQAGEQAEWVKPGGEYEHIYAASIFTRSHKKCECLQEMYGDKLEIGGTGWDVHKVLPDAVEYCNPDYSLYNAEDIARKMRGIGTREHKLKKAQQIVNAGMGFTSRGCIRKCPFCFVPKKEGPLRQESEIADIINPRSNVIILHDNNLTADPYCIDKLHEIRDRGLIVDINQGCDIRIMTDEIAQALSEVRHLHSLHYAWDLMGYENQVLEGINVLKRYVKTYKHMCFVLIGFDTTPEQDFYRFRKLTEQKIDPFAMIYNERKTPYLRHFARWVNSRIYKKCSFDEYDPWVKAQHVEESLF